MHALNVTDLFVESYSYRPAKNTWWTVSIQMALVMTILIWRFFLVCVLFFFFNSCRLIFNSVIWTSFDPNDNKPVFILLHCYSLGIFLSSTDDEATWINCHSIKKQNGKWFFTTKGEIVQLINAKTMFSVSAYCAQCCLMPCMRRMNNFCFFFSFIVFFFLFFKCKCIRLIIAKLVCFV